MSLPIRAFRSIVLPFLILFTSQLLCAQPIPTPAGNARIKEIRTLVGSELAARQYPGVAVAVWQGGEMVMSEGFGYASIEEHIPVDPAHTLFRVGSISKALSAVALGVLIERHNFDPDAPIQQYVPYFPEKRWPITTRQVAEHIAGIRHYRDNEFLSNIHYNSVHDALGIFMDDSLLFEPGSAYAYSSYGWNLVSAAIEGGAQEDFLSFIRREVFEPMGMVHTYPDDVAIDTLPRVTFYDFIDNRNQISPVVDNSNKWAGGGFISTAEDLVRFGVGMLSHTVLNRQTTQALWTPGTLNDGSQTTYGIGWDTNSDKHGYHWVGHAGGSVGGSSMLLIYPELKLVVVTMINRSQSGSRDLAFQIADRFLE